MTMKQITPWFLAATMGFTSSASLLVGCSDEVQRQTYCPSAGAVQVIGKASPPAADGSVKVIGMASFAPAVLSDASDDDQKSTEGTILDIYVAGERATKDEFNFRSWTVDIPLSRLCAHAIDGTSKLPIRAYLLGPTGTCVWESKSGEEVMAKVDADACANSSESTNIDAGSDGSGGNGTGSSSGGGGGGGGGSGGGGGGGGSGGGV